MINPGCVVHFNGFFSISILGSIDAIGSQVDSIRFITTDTTIFHKFDFELGGWNGIKLVSKSEGSDSTIFEFYRFNFSKSDTIVKHGGVFISKTPIVGEYPTVISQITGRLRMVVQYS